MNFLKPKSRFGRVYNLRPGRPVRSHVPRILASANPASLPPIFDMASQFPAPYDQGQWGTCFANATAGIIQFLTKAPTIPSRLYIAWNACTKEAEAIVKEENGITSLEDTIEPITTLGYAEESMSSAPWDYIQANLDVKPPPSVCQDAMSRIIGSYASVNPDLNVIKTTLVNGNPILFGMQVYSQFESDQCLNDGMVEYPGWFARWTQSLGGHAVVAVGWDDGKQCIHVRNSWGPNVQDHGYFWLPFSYVTDPKLRYDFWVLNLR